MKPFWDALRAFFSKYSFAVIWMAVIVGGGILFSFIVQENSRPLVSITPGTFLPAKPVPPPPPSMMLNIKKAKTGNTLVVQWAHLPFGTTGIDIFRGLSTKPTSTWSLYKHVSLSLDELSGGSAEINIGKSTLDGYSFYFQAIMNPGDNGSSTTGNETSTTLFTSGIIIPGVVPPPPPPGNPTSTGQGGTPPAPPANPTSTTPTSTGPQVPPPPPGSPPPSQGDGGTPTPPPTPSGTPYYNPQIQISGYGADQSANFYAQHVDQRIQIGWQSLPTSTTKIVISRSTTESGPWTIVLSQEVADTGAYSLQIADNTVGTPYYYEMSAFNGNTTIATYGPVYLPPAGQ